MNEDEIYRLLDKIEPRMRKAVGRKANSFSTQVELIIRVVKELENEKVGTQAGA